MYKWARESSFCFQNLKRQSKKNSFKMIDSTTIILQTKIEQSKSFIDFVDIRHSKVVSSDSIYYVVGFFADLS